MTTPDEAQALLPVTPEDIRRAEDWAYMLNRMGGVYLDHSQRQGLASQFAAHRQSHSLPGDVGMADERKAVLQNKRVNDAIQTALERGELAISSNGYLAALTPSALSGDAGEVRENVLFNLTWIAPPSPALPDGRRVHPEPMTGRQSFPSWENALRFMSKRCEGTEFVSLTQTTSRTVDRSAEFRAALPSHQGAGEP